ncbi:MAG TPA: TonB-dependent receptor, partial [Longimicrobiales bacterium]|nr:TonB-dependent receptor [Longimicrobiales bacterium]
GGGFNPDLEAQTATGVEAGARGLLPGGLGWELTLFRTDLADELVPFEIPSQPGRTFFRNAGTSRHQGVEARLEADLGSGLGARATWTRVDARYETFEVDGEDFAGNRIPGLAPDRLHGLLDQERPGWFWAVEAEWTDEVPVDDAGEEAADAYALVGARVGLRGVALGGLELSPFAAVSNAFDEAYVAAVTVNAFGGRYYEPGPGRTVHVGATVSWSSR